MAAVRQAGGFASVHALPLRLRGQAIGALNVFHREPGPLPDVDLSLGQALADVATIGILSERAIRRGEVLNEQLQTALNSRVIIEQAKGVLDQRGAQDMNTRSTGSAATPGTTTCAWSRWPARSWPVTWARTCCSPRRHPPTAAGRR